MFDMMLLQSALSALSTLFGSLGMFCYYYSFSQPTLAAYTLVFLGIASAIVYCAPKR